jgi:hypothetical protein
LGVSCRLALPLQQSKDHGPPATHRGQGNAIRQGTIDPMKTFAFPYLNADGKTALQEVRNVADQKEAEKFLTSFVKSRLLDGGPYVIPAPGEALAFTRRYSNPYPIW